MTINRLKYGVWLFAFFGFYAHIVPADTNNAVSIRHFNETSFNNQINAYLHSVIAQLFRQDVAIDQDEHHIFELVIKQLDVMASLKTPTEVIQHAQVIAQSLQVLEENNAQLKSHVELLHSALAVRLASSLCHKARATLVDVLSDLREHSAYWAYQNIHPWYYATHKSPLKFFTHKSQAGEIAGHMRLLQGVQQEHFRLLGSIITWSKAFDSAVSAQEQLVWARSGLTIVQVMCGGVAVAQEGTVFNGIMQQASQLDGLLDQHKKVISKLIYEAKKPSHVVRHWMGYTAVATGALAALIYLKKNPNKIPALWAHGKQAAKDAYTNYLAEPLRDIKDAVWGGDQEDHVQQDLNTALNKINEIVSGAGTVTREEAVTSYERDAIRARNLVYPKGEPENNSSNNNNNNADDLSVWVSDKEIQQAAQNLDREFMIQRVGGWLKLYAANASKAGFFGWGHSIDNVIQEAVVYAVTLMQIFGHHGGNVAENGQKVVTIFMQEIIKMRRQLRITIGFVALLPAAGIAYGAYKLVTKFGSLFLPSPYDDKPIRDAITNSSDVLDECKYVHERTYLDDIEVGQLYYYCSRIRKELPNVSPESKQDIEKYLHNVEQTNTVDGKIRYLEKLYGVYRKWHEQQAA